MPEPWERQPGEPAGAYNALEAVFAQWPSINVTQAYRDVTGKAQARCINGTWANWKKFWQWDERIKAFDEWKQSEKSRAQMEAAAEAYQAELETYRRMHENAGKAAFNAVIVCNKILQTAAADMASDPEKHPKSYAELKQLSGVIGDFMKYGPDVWASALGIPEIQAQIEANGKKE